MKLDILAFGAHPDDVELSCSGTLLKHIEAGYKVGLIDLTRGELGTRGSGELRLVEAEKSRGIMGAEIRENLNLGDGFFSHSQENILAIVKVIRKYQPKIVLANALDDRHPDHAKGAKIVHDACFLSGLMKIETEIDGVKQEKWRPDNLFHYIQDKQLNPDFVVDITKYWDKKMQCIQAFGSQFFDPNSTEPSSPISRADFLPNLKGKNRVFGRETGYELAEGFNISRIVGVKNLFDLD